VTDGTTVQTYQKPGALLQIAVSAAVVWFAFVLALKFKRTPLAWNRVSSFLHDYADFHIWHAYTAGIVVSLAFAIWIGWVVLKCGAWALRVIMRDAELPPLEGRVFSAALGFFVISTTTLLLGSLRLWYGGIFLSLLIAATVVFLLQEWRTLHWPRAIPPITFLKDWWTHIAVVLLVIAGAIIFVGDISPEIFFDSLVYHLAIPNLYLLNHRIYQEPHFPLAGLIMNVQMFWGFALSVSNEVTVKLLHGAAALLLFCAFVAFEKRYLAQGAGLLGTLVFLSMPIVSSIATTAGIDVASSALHFVALFAVIRMIAEDHEDDAGKGWTQLAGLLTGIAATCKATSLPVIPLACLFIVWRQKQPSRNWTVVCHRLGRFLIWAGLAAFPFYLKNIILYHNPVYPLAATHWGIPALSAEHWANLVRDTAAPASYSFLQLAMRFVYEPWSITINGADGLQNFIGPLLLGLFPLVLIVRPHGTASRVLAGYSLGLWIIWLFSTTAQVRFGMPLLAVLSLLLAHTALSLPAASWGRQSILAFCMAGAAWNLYYGAVLTVMRDGWRVVGGMISASDYLKAPHFSYPAPDYEALDWMNNSLPPGSKVMIVGDSRSHYSLVPVVLSSPFDVEPIVDAARKASNGADMAKQLQQAGITHLFVNLAEAVRTESYDLFPWDRHSWTVLEDFWNCYVQLRWTRPLSGTDGPNALFVYQIRSDAEPLDPDSPPPPNPFERWRPR
jgi:hypothetical protein